jgi:hypothetical protein
MAAAEFQVLLRWIILHLNSSNADVVDICVQFLQSLLSITTYRILFFEYEGSVTPYY